MESIAVYNTRGGVGKSAVVVFLADFLSTVFEKRVLVVDLDPQGTSSMELIGRTRLDSLFANDRSLFHLMKRRLSGELTKDIVLTYTVARMEHPPRKGTSYLGPLSVMGLSQRNHRDLVDYFFEMEKSIRSNYLNLLSDALAPLKEEFDICLIDFPAHESRYLATLGLRASDWWLLPTKPDYSGVEDLQTAIDAVGNAQKNSNHRIAALGTLINICQNRQSRAYRRAKHGLQALADENAIPPLFSSEISYRVDALNALDRQAIGESTLAKRYGSSTYPLYLELRAFARETCARLSGETPIRKKLSFIENIRKILNKHWR